MQHYTGHLALAKTCSWYEWFTVDSFAYPCDVFCYLDTNVCTFLQSKSSCCDYRLIIEKTYSYDVFPSLAKLYWLFPSTYSFEILPI